MQFKTKEFLHGKDFMELKTKNIKWKYKFGCLFLNTEFILISHGKLKNILVGSTKFIRRTSYLKA